MLEYAPVIWDPHQLNLKSDTEMMQRRELQDESFVNSVLQQVLVTLTLDSSCKNWNPDRRSTQVLNGVQPKSWATLSILNLHGTETPRPSKRTTKGQQVQCTMLQDQCTIHYLNSSFPSAIRFWNSVTKSIPSVAPAANSLDTFKCKLGGWAQPAI